MKKPHTHEDAYILAWLIVATCGYSETIRWIGFFIVALLTFYSYKNQN